MSAQIFHTRVWPLRDRLYRLAYRLLGERTEAEDVVQETMLKLWEKRTDLIEVNNVEAWSFRLLRNQSIDRYRSLKRRTTQDLANAPEPVSNASNPSQQIEQKELRQAIDQIIQGLPEQRRMVLHFREVEERSYQEIADMLDISLDQVRIDLHRARKALRTQLIKNPCYE
ncbi:MAG: RNA polymerase sigma factor [Bacteroidota bacterium]